MSDSKWGGDGGRDRYKRDEKIRRVREQEKKIRREEHKKKEEENL